MVMINRANADEDHCFCATQTHLLIQSWTSCFQQCRRSPP